MKWRILEPVLNIYLHYNGTWGRDGVDDSTNAECDTIRALHSTKERQWRKANKAEKRRKHRCLDKWGEKQLHVPRHVLCSDAMLIRDTGVILEHGMQCLEGHLCSVCTSYVLSNLYSALDIWRSRPEKISDKNRFTGNRKLLGNKMWYTNFIFKSNIICPRCYT